MTEQELLVDCLRRLNQEKVAYMLTGSMASNAWGIPRMTHDLDFVIGRANLRLAIFLKTFLKADSIQKPLNARE